MSKLFTLKGRLSRLGYLKWITVILIIPSVVLTSIICLLPIGSPYDQISLISYFLFSCFAVVCILPVSVRRLHDMGWHGLFSLLLFTPISFILILLLLLYPSKKEENKYGPVLPSVR